MTSETLLNDIWSVYFHDPQDTNWNFSSYVRIGSINTVEEFWGYQSAIRPFLTRGTFFIMREHVFPCWDDPGNRDGETISLKISKDVVVQHWESIAIRLLGERLMTRHDAWDHVNGLSISPKKMFCIVKIWMRTAGVFINREEDFRLPDDYLSELVFSTNSENIKNNNNRMENTKM